MTDRGSARRQPGVTSWPLLIALRYLRSSRKDAFVSFLSAVAVGGIALGVAALILALSALNGLQRALRAEVLRRTPEIEVHLPLGDDLDDARGALAAVDGVRDVSRRLRGNGWVLVGGSARPVEILGYDGALPRRFPEARQRQPGVYLSDRFARIHGLSPGDVVEVASTRSRLTPMGPLPRLRRLEIRETFEHPLLEPSEQIAIPWEQAAGLLGTASAHLVVETGDLDLALRVAPALEAALPAGADLLTWEDLNAALLFALRLEKRLTFVAAFLIVLVGALALVSDLSLIIASRRREIGILGTMGATSKGLRRAFLALGALLSGCGLVLGCLLGTLLSTVLDSWKVIRLPGDFFLLDHIPFLVDSGDLLRIAIVTVVVTLVCCWIGAGKVTAMRPVEALRT